MSSLFEAMPGIVMPVSEVTTKLSRMWEDDFQHGYDHASEYRASQMNLVLHFGRATQKEEALACFNTALHFAQRYPCRMIVLCPEDKIRDEVMLEGKLFCQCYIGKDQRNFCCCECLTLGYTPEPGYSLENQVSVWLESDLPTYYWLHRVMPGRVVESYLNFLVSCKRVIYDSSIEPEDYAYLPWPSEDSVQDIAFTRTLPIRQAMGHFLSGYDAKVLVENLKAVKIKFTENMWGEAHGLLEWQRTALEGCCNRASLPFYVTFLKDKKDCKEACIDVVWEYSDQKKLAWKYCVESNHIKVDLALDRDMGQYTLPIKPLKTEDALAEALFF